MSILDFDALSLLFNHYLSTEHFLLGTPPPSWLGTGAPFDIARHTNTHGEPLKRREPVHQYARTIYARTVGDTDFSLKSSDSRPLDPDPKYQSTENERFLLEDIEHYKVFVDITLCPSHSIIKYVRHDRGFITSLRKYIRKNLFST